MPRIFSPKIPSIKWLKMYIYNHNNFNIINCSFIIQFDNHNGLYFETPFPPWFLSLSLSLSLSLCRIITLFSRYLLSIDSCDAIASYYCSDHNHPRDVVSNWEWQSVGGDGMDGNGDCDGLGVSSSISVRLLFADDYWLVSSLFYCLVSLSSIKWSSFRWECS